MSASADVAAAAVAKMFLPESFVADGTSAEDC